MGGKRAWVFAALLASGGWLAPIVADAQGRYQPEGPARRAFESAEALRQQGDALRRQDDAKAAAAKYAEALEGFEEAVEADSDYIDAYARIGQLAYRLQRPGVAIDRLEDGLRRAPKNPDLRFWQGQNLLLAGRPKEGVPLLERVAADAPDAWPEVFLALGNHYFKQQDFRAAEPAFEQFVKRTPDALAVRGKLGNTYFQLKKYGQALAEFEAVRAKRPDDVRVLINIGNAHFQMGSFAKAITVLERALALEPDRAGALFNLAHSHFELGQYAEAVRYYARFNTAQPNNFNGLYFQGSAHMALGQDAPALAHLARAAALKPTVVNPVYKMGLIHLKAGHADLAQPFLDKALSLKGDNPWVISALGSLARLRGDTDSAVRLHARAVNLAPEKARLHANLALSALRAGDTAHALAAFEKALSLDSVDPWIRQLGGTVLAAHAKARAAAGAPKEAGAALDRALTLRPGDPTLLANRALLRLEEGQVVPGAADAEAAARAAPTDARVQLALGHARVAQGRAADAVPLLTSAAEASPSPATHAALGVARLLAGDVAGAVATLDAAAARWPKVAALDLDRALARFARLSARLKRSRGAGRDASDLRLALAQVRALPPALASRVHYAAVILALRQGDGATARAQLGALGQAMRAAKGRGGSPLAKAPRQHLEFLRALSAYQTRRDAVVESILAKIPAAKRGSTHAGQLARATQERLGQAAYAKGDLKGAAQHLRAANTLAKQPVTTHNLAVLQWLAGRKGPAERVWKAVRTKVPEATFNLAVAAEGRGQHEAAWRGYSRYAATGRAHAGKAKEIAEAKRRVFGFGEAP